MNQTMIEKDPAGKKLVVTRRFDAPLEQVWKAWTEQELLDQWWAPRPWKAVTKTMEFIEGGYWLYAMEGPDGSKAWCRVDFLQINPLKNFTVENAFCDEEGHKTESFPSMHWKNVFVPENGQTKVEVTITFTSEADLEKIIEMGFKEGFTAAHGNLDELLQKMLVS